MRNPAPRKTARGLAVLLALAGVPLLSACGGGTEHPGAAATLDGERITVAQVQSRVTAVREAQLAAPKGEALVAKTPELARGMLYTMLFERVLDRAAADTGAGQPSAAETGAARTALEKRFGSAKALEAAALQGGVAPSQLDAFARQDAQFARLMRTFSGDQQALGAALEKAARELDIDVNPRFGRWDAQALRKGTLQDVRLPWLKQAAAQPAQERLPQ
ncbi:hypothetical protein ACFQLX_21600 [Streptomyces polyrhachis]|uniref:Lipoprotein n=1 Tax=Streptomyces polyrhachis TaxID=1282885 RepID=A0ABW2GNT9_9ACTN